MVGDSRNLLYWKLIPQEFAHVSTNLLCSVYWRGIKIVNIAQVIRLHHISPSPLSPHFRKKVQYSTRGQLSGHFEGWRVGKYSFIDYVHILEWYVHKKYKVFCPPLLWQNIDWLTRNFSMSLGYVGNRFSQNFVKIGRVVFERSSI